MPLGVDTDAMSKSGMPKVLLVGMVLSVVGYYGSWLVQEVAFELVQ